jgi:hypothetical protein
MDNASVATASSVVTTKLTQAVGSFQTSEREKRRHQREQRQWTFVVAGTAVASVLSAMIAMYMEASSICYVAFLFPLVTAPVVIYQRRRLNKLPTLNQEINLCRELVNRMTVQNNRLQAESGKLATQVTRLHAAEATLQQWAARAGMNQTDLQALCLENGKVTRRMRQLTQAAELQTLLKTMLASDMDHNRTISADELNQLSHRLQIFSNSRRPIDDGLLRQAFGMSGGSVISTTTLFRLTNELLEENDTIERLERDFLDDMMETEVIPAGFCRAPTGGCDSSYTRCVD